MSILNAKSQMPLGVILILGKNGNHEESWTPELGTGSEPVPEWESVTPLGPLLQKLLAHLSGVDPDGEVLREVLDDVRDGVARLAGRALQHRVVGVRHAQASGGEGQGKVKVDI